MAAVRYYEADDDGPVVTEEICKVCDNWLEKCTCPNRKRKAKRKAPPPPPPRRRR